MNFIKVTLNSRHSLKKPPHKGLIFPLLGYFDYLEIDILDRTSIGKKMIEHDSFNSREMILFNCDDCDSNYIETLKSDFSNDLPLCVMTLIEDLPSTDRLFSDASQSPFSNLSKAIEYYKSLFDRYTASKEGENTSAKMDAFLTLSCVDSVLFFRTNSYSFVHDFICSLSQNHYVETSYSLYGAFSDFAFTKEQCSKLDSDQRLELSIRVINKPGCVFMSECNSINALKNTKKATLAGNHHELYHASSNVYELLNEIYSKQGQLNLENPSVADKIKVCRTTLLFKEGLIPSLLDSSQKVGIENQQKLCKEKYEGILDQLLSTYGKMQECWKDIFQKGTVDLPCSVYAETIQYSEEVNLFIKTNTAFFTQLFAQSMRFENSEIAHILYRPIASISGLCELMCNDFILQSVRVYPSASLTFYRIFLSQVQSTIEEIAQYVLDLIQMQRSWIEERGLYHDGVSQSAKLTMGYYEYANRISNELYKTCLDRDDPTISENMSNPITFFITTHLTETKVQAIEYFSNVNSLCHQLMIREQNAFVCIKIAQHSIFNCREVKAAITHEVSHFSGWRNRELRARCVAETVCSWLVSMILPEYFFPETVSYDAKKSKILQEIKAEFEIEYNKVFTSLVDRITNALMNTLTDLYNNRLEWAYTSNLIPMISEILISWLGAPYTEMRKEDPISQNFIDLPVVFVNERLDLHQSLEDIVLTHSIDAIGETLSYEEVYADIANWHRTSYELVNKIIYETRQRIFKQIAPVQMSSDIFAGIELDKDYRLKERLNFPACADCSNYANTRLYNYVYSMCNCYSECYCDYIMVKLLHLTPQEYTNYVWKTNGAKAVDKFRVWTVLQNLYTDSLGDVSILAEQLKKDIDNSGYIQCSLQMNRYLEAIKNDPGLTGFFSRMEIVCNSNTITGDPWSDEFLDVYMCYSNLYFGEEE